MTTDAFVEYYERESSAEAGVRRLQTTVFPPARLVGHQLASGTRLLGERL